MTLVSGLPLAANGGTPLWVPLYHITEGGEGREGGKGGREGREGREGRGERGEGETTNYL